MTRNAAHNHIPLTLLYAPGNRPDRVAKALVAGADVVVIDLEDAVVPAQKTAARSHLAPALSEWGGSPQVQVRVNARGSEWHKADLETVAELDLRVGIRLPKVHSAEDVQAAATTDPARGIHALIESALGVENAFGIASAGVISVGLGEADLRSSLGLRAGAAGEPGLAWQRARIVNAAAAAGLLPPLMSVYTNVRDEDGLRRSCEAGRALGFLGRSAIHPAQLAPIRESFTPTHAEVLQAEETLRRVGDRTSDAAGTVVLADGSFIDAAMVETARRVLGIAQQNGNAGDEDNNSV
ncbi:CoA ester lyase [Leucobacter sp. wl10]|uniref:HpcH/HpaI aldolase/citrate lyase family protein n=1 Tax=Leucobacter sp. wl10 TaxID=2304677 RepID=UPI000E5B898C|nr:CoA ester lyase [Leucobacter sp. wl10]RGE16305.1 CoA ester lyase [Leucobacter sp. wl10]